MKHIVKTLLFLLGGIVGGYLLLVAVFCLPTGRIHNNVLESATAFEGGYKVLINDNIATKTDDWTDAVMLLAADNNNDENPFTASINAYLLKNDTIDPYDVIRDTNNEGNYQFSYSRYWHGYLLFLKPLLLFLNYSQIQVLTSFTVIMLIVGVVYLLQKKKLSKYIMPYTLTIMLMFPVAISLSLQFLSVFAIFNIAIIFMLLFFDKILESKNFFYVFLTIGMLTCYFDLLTYPIVTLGIPLLIWLLMMNKDKVLSFGQNFKQIVLGLMGWCIGYFGIWIGKLLLGSIITGNNLFNAAIGAANTRTSGSAFSEEVSRVFSITEAFDKIFTEPVCLMIIILVVIALILIIMKKIRISKEKAKANLWMLIFILIPLIWYVVLANHSASHVFFTYRTLSVLIFAIGCYIVSIIEKPKNTRRKK